MSVRQLIAARRDRMTEGHRRLSDFLIIHPFDAAGLNIVDLAKAAAVSTASVNRFVTSLGFARFTDFKAQLFADVRSVMAPEAKIAGLMADDNQTAPIARGLESAALCIAATTESVDVAAIERMVERMLKARKVVFLGLGASHFTAGYAAHLCGLYLDSVSVLSTEGGTEQSYRRLVGLSEQDVFVAITIPRYSRETVLLADEARQRGAYVVAIADAPTAPVSLAAQDVLVAGASHPLFSGSVVGTIALVETIAIVLARHSKAAVARHEQLTELCDRFVFPAEASPYATTTKQGK